jgi:hypothetical protein
VLADLLQGAPSDSTTASADARLECQGGGGVTLWEGVRLVQAGSKFFTRRSNGSSLSISPLPSSHLSSSATAAGGAGGGGREEGGGGKGLSENPFPEAGMTGGGEKGRRGGGVAEVADAEGVGVGVGGGGARAGEGREEGGEGTEEREGGWLAKWSEFATATVVVVGDGNLSFSLALARAFAGMRIVATTYDSATEVRTHSRGMRI